MTSKSFSVRQFDIIGDSGNAVITSSEYIELNTPRVAISTDISVGGKFQSNVVLDIGYSFSGSGQNLTNIPAGQLTGALPAIDGSALTGVVGSGSGIEIRDSGTPVGTASTVDFGANLTVSPVSAGVVTVTASGGGGGTSYWVSTAAGIHTLSNVGVGTTNPTSKLDVYGDITISGNGFLYDSTDPNYNFRPTNWQLKGGGYITESNTVNGYIQIGEKYIYGYDDITKNDFYIQSNGDSYFRGGNLGVGTNNATSKLSVQGDGRFTGVVTATSFVGDGSGLENLPGPQTGIGTFDAIVGVSTVIDSFDIATENISIIEYNIFVNNGENRIQSQKALIMLGDEAYSQEYVIMYSTNHLVSVGATISGGICNVTMTPSSGVSGLTTFKFSKGGSV